MRLLGELGYIRIIGIELVPSLDKVSWVLVTDRGGPWAHIYTYIHIYDLRSKTNISLMLKALRPYFQRYFLHPIFQEKANKLLIPRTILNQCEKSWGSQTFALGIVRGSKLATCWGAGSLY